MQRQERSKREANNESRTELLSKIKGEFSLELTCLLRDLMHNCTDFGTEKTAMGQLAYLYDGKQTEESEPSLIYESIEKFPRNFKYHRNIAPKTGKFYEMVNSSILYTNVDFYIC